jgi:hypothetical protein
MANWTFARGSDAMFEGTALMATVPGAPYATYSLAGATMHFMAGSVLGTKGYYRTSVGGTNFQFPATTSGVYQFSIANDDTEGWAPGNYLFDVWIQTSGLKEYRILQGTIVLLPTMGTV